MDTVLLTFVNQPSNPLPTLQEEDDTLARLLSPGAKEQHYLLHRDSIVTLEKLAPYLSLYQDSLTLFLFSGHAGRDRLILADSAASHQGIAQLLGQCPNLKLVFLNGCATQDQVNELLMQGVPMVLASSAPVDDRSATIFSTRFFEALQLQYTVNEAFEMAKGAIQVAFNGIEMKVHRGMPLQVSTEPIWGLFLTEKTERVLEWRLPFAKAASFEDFIPNHLLIDTLFDALAEFDEIKKLNQQAARGLPVPLSKKRMYVLNALPFPLAEPLRKLVVPVERENVGFDKLSIARLEQIAFTYQCWLRFLISIQLSQMGEKMQKEAVTDALIPEMAAALKKYLTQGETTDYYSIALALYFTLQNNEIAPVYIDLAQCWGEDKNVENACLFLENLSQNINRIGSTDQTTVQELCIKAEKCLCLLINKLKFVSPKMRLASVRKISVSGKAKNHHYTHETVVLHDFLGGFDVSNITLSHPLAQQSILLINEEDWSYLNLSPFIIDEYAFAFASDIVKLLHFRKYTPGAFERLTYEDDNRQKLYIKEDRYPLVSETFENFYASLVESME
jgi:hypothetical protein